MNVRGGWLDFHAWNAADVHWYAHLVAHVQQQEFTADAATDVLDQLNARPWTECLRLIGDQTEACIYTDTVQQKWYDDRKGRWSAKVSGDKVFLHHRVVQLQPNRTRLAGDKVSHICGHCDCIRLEHIRYQTAAEDILDRRYHQGGRKGEIRPQTCPL